MGIAKEVLGSDYHLMTQIENYFYGGFDEFYGEVIKANPNITREEVIAKIQEIENNNTEMNQRTLLFSLIPSRLNDTLNIVWDGNYGLEFRINNPRYIKVIGYDVPNFHGQGTQSYQVSFIDKIPSDSKYDVLKDFLEQNPRLDSFEKAFKVVDDLYMNSRNSRDFNYYQKLTDLLGEII
jgi:hypothetical protein